MNLLIINGSPRGRSGNTRVFLDHFLQGFLACPGNQAETLYLLSEADRDEAGRRFAQAGAVLLGFPLYADAMPFQVKDLIERLPLGAGPDGAGMLFFIQSGFAESTHTQFLPAYFAKLCRRLGRSYLGTIRRGGGEALKAQPLFLNGHLLTPMIGFGREFGATGTLDPESLRRFAGKRRLNWMERLISEWGSEWFFWNPALFRNGAFRDRFAQPYQARPQGQEGASNVRR